MFSKFRIPLLFALGAAGVYGLIYQDLVSRAKESYLEGEKYMRWFDHPQEKKAYFDADFEQKKQALDKKRVEKKLSESEYSAALENLEFDRTFRVEESSLKYAYQWYKDAYQLFTPPESKWSRQAKEKASVALGMWKEELTRQNVPFEEFMFE